MKLVTAAASLLLLTCCTLIPHAPVKNGTMPTQQIKPHIDHAIPVTEGGIVSNDQDQLTLNQSLEQSGLNVSYNLLALPVQEGFLLRLSLIMRNIDKNPVRIAPKIYLSAGDGKNLDAYSKTAFLSTLSRMPASTQHGVIGPLLDLHDSHKITARERAEWSNRYWVRRHYKLPMQGIEIAELVYHSESLRPPYKLTVDLSGHKFEFSNLATVQVAGK